MHRQVVANGNMANSNYDAISSEFDGIKLEFKAVYEDMDGLETGTRNVTTGHRPHRRLLQA